MTIEYNGVTVNDNDIGGVIQLLEIGHIKSIKPRDEIKKITIGVHGGRKGGVFISDEVLDWIDETIEQKKKEISGKD